MFGIGQIQPAAIYRKMGYFADQRGILRRYKREQEFWNPHLKSTQKAIIEFASKKPGKKVAVLGSGWLLDVPLHELLQIYSEVWLFDIRHPKEILKNTKSNRTFFIETDLSGFVQPIYKFSRQHKIIIQEHLEILQPFIPFNFHDFDCVISCNILDQLDDLLVAYLKSQVLIEGEVINRFRSMVQKQHLNILPKDKTLLITDVKEVKVDNNGTVLNERDLLYISIDPYREAGRWIWKFDNNRTYYNHCNTWYEVWVVEV